MRRRKKERKRSSPKGFWQSYSDMMAAMLLVFILILSAISLRSQETAENLEKTRKAYTEQVNKGKQVQSTFESEEEQYLDQLGAAEDVIAALTDEKGILESEIEDLEKRLAGYEGQTGYISEIESENTALGDDIVSLRGDNRAKDKRIGELESEIGAVESENDAYRKRNTELETENSVYKGINSELESENGAYKDQIDGLESEKGVYKDRIDELESENGAYREKIGDLNSEITGYKNTIGTMEGTITDRDNTIEGMTRTLEDIVGIRREIIKALSSEFDESELHVNQQTGSITLRSELLFESNSSVMKQEGKDFLDHFFPRYVEILMGEKYQDYIAEIIIEGHTDTRRGYLFNLNLSQQRALSVAAYLIPDEEDIQLHTLQAQDSGLFTEEEKKLLRKIITVNGRSWSDPVYNASGEVDMDASRRVEISFRLKDDEMIREMAETFTKS